MISIAGTIYEQGELHSPNHSLEVVLTKKTTSKVARSLTLLVVISLLGR